MGANSSLEVALERERWVAICFGHRDRPDETPRPEHQGEIGLNMDQLLVEFPCQRCGIDVTEATAYVPDEGSWHDAYLCYKCKTETAVKKRKKKTKR